MLLFQSFGVSVNIDLKRQCRISKSVRNECKHTHTHQVVKCVSQYLSINQADVVNATSTHTAALRYSVCVCMYACVLVPVLYPSERMRDEEQLVLSV